MKATNWTDLGYLPLQDHQPGVPVNLRMQVAGARISRLGGNGNDPGESMTEYAREAGLGTLGDVHPWAFWQTRSRGLRGTGIWAQTFAGVVGDAQAAGGGPTTGGGQERQVFPVRAERWRSDLRLGGKELTLPPGFPTLPKGHMLGVWPGTEESRQDLVVGSVDPRLYAPGAHGPGSVGTIVCDMQPDYEPCMDGESIPGVGGRHARLQSLLRVVAMPKGVSAGLLYSAGNMLAINYTASEQDEIAGYGAIWCTLTSGGAGSGPITPGGGSGNPSGPITPGGSVLLGVTGGSDSVALGEDDTTGKGPAEFGRYQPKRAGGRGVALMAQQGGWGPITGGATGDKHTLGLDRDGNPIQSAHVSTNAYFFRDDKYDGPLLFEGDYPYPPGMPLQSRVHLSWDNDLQHPFGGATAAGYWRWWCEVPFLVPGGGSPPNVPPNRPPTTGQPPTPRGPTPSGPTPPTGPRPPAPPNPPSPPSGPPTGGQPRQPGQPITPNPANPGVPGGRRFPGYPLTGPETGNGPAGPTAEPPSGPAIYGDSPTPGPTTGGGPTGPSGELPSGPAVYGWQWPQRPSLGVEPGTSNMVGGTDLGSRSLFTILHPFNEAFGAISFRPQLWRRGEMSTERAGNTLPAEALRLDEEWRPQVLTARAWGAQSGADWVHKQAPDDSRARGGIADGGLLFCPPEFEGEDYLAGGDGAVSSPTTTSYVTAAPGVSFALGLPAVDGGLATGAVTIGVSGGVLQLRQLNTSRVAQTLLTAQTVGGEIAVGIGGTQALAIPRGTTAQRPASPAPGAVRVNSSGAADVLEFWNVQAGAWVTVGSGGGGGTSDHGLLTGLGDDDHTQYIPVNASRQPTSPLGSLAAPTIPEHYVRGVELTASQAAQDAATLAFLSAFYMPLGGPVVSLAQASNRILGRSTAGTGAVEELVVGSGLNLAAGVLSVNVPVPAQVDDLDMNSGVLAGRTTAGVGPVEDIAIGAGLSLAGGVLSATGGGGGGGGSYFPGGW